MANVIKHKRGSGSDPVASDLVVGEVAIRTDVGKLFTKMDNGSVAEIAGGGSDIAINTLSSSSATGGGSATFNGSAYRFTLSAPPSVSAQQLLVSINGVIQKPVAGTGQPSEGFSVDGTDIILGDAPATGSDFFILTFKSLGVSEPADNSVTSAKIVDGAIVNADINASAAIAGSKISPTFTSSVTISNTNPKLFFTDTNNDSDYAIVNNGGVFRINDETNSINRFSIASDGTTTILQNLDVGAGIDVTGAITGTGDMTIDTNTLHVDSSNNRVGIGTTTPQKLLDVRGEFAISNNNASYWDFDRDDSDGSLKIKDTGTERLRIDSSGRVGIGCTPTAQFAHNLIQIGNQATLGANAALSTTGQTFLTHNLYFDTSGTFQVFNTSNANEGAIISLADGLFKFSNSAATTGTPTVTERMRIDSSGRVGIGNTNAQQLLHVWPDTANTSSAYVRVTSGDRGSGTGIDLGSDSDGDGRLNVVSNANLKLYTNNTERMRIDSSGRVLIGTTSGNDALVVDGGSDAGTIQTNSTNSNGNMMTFKCSGTSKFFIGSAGSFITGNSGTTNQGIRAEGHLLFATGGASQKMRLGTNGALGVGGNANRMIHAVQNSSNGTVGVGAFENGDENNSNTILFLSTVRNGTSGNNFLQCNRDQNNNGQGVKATFFIRTNGDCDSDTNSYGGISDIKLKENIVDAKSQWDDIKNIKVRNFNFKDNPNQKMLGVVAQEVETVSAGLVKDCPDENITSPGPEGTSTKSVKYSILYMKAIKALQEAQIRIETLESKVTALEAK